MHLLGYLFDPEHPAIVAEQPRLRTERAARLRLMTERMAAAGFPVDVDTVFALLPEGASAGRPHLARALVGRGRRRVGGRGVREAALHRQPVLRREGRHARGDGGRRWCARPAAWRCSPTRWRGVAAGWWTSSAIAELATAGLAGLEVDHPDHAPADRALLRGLAAELDLVVDGVERLPRHEQDDAHRRGDHGPRPVRGPGRPRDRGRRGPRRLTPPSRHVRRHVVGLGTARRARRESARECAPVTRESVRIGLRMSHPRSTRQLPRSYIRAPDRTDSRAPCGARGTGLLGGTTVEGWTAARSSGWTRSTPRSRPGRCCASRPPGSRPGPTARGATG